jgi:hypothetical protein
VHLHTTTCPMAPDLISWPRWALTLSRVLWLRTSPIGWGGLRRCHVPYSSRPCLPFKVGSDAATCPMPLDLTSQLRWAPAVSCVIWLWTSPPSWGGFQCCHMPYASEPHLPVEVDSDAVMCTTGPYVPWASSIKKSLAGLPVQLCTHVLNARVHVFKAPHVRAIMRLQDVHASSGVNTYKACRYASTVRYNTAIVRRQHYGSLVCHRCSAKWLDSTVPHC